MINYDAMFSAILWLRAIILIVAFPIISVAMYEKSLIVGFYALSIVLLYVFITCMEGIIRAGVRSVR